MPAASFFWRSSHIRRVVLAAVLVALGSGAVAEVWARALVAQGYVLPEVLSNAFARLEAGSWRAVAVVAVVGPLLEETIFRGGLQRLLLWFYRPGLAVPVGALVFAVAHLNWMQFGPALWMGLVTGVLFARTGSLTLCVLWHATYNLQFLLPYSGISAGGQLADAERSSRHIAAWGIRALLLIVGAVWLSRLLRALPAECQARWLNPLPERQPSATRATIPPDAPGDREGSLLPNTTLHPPGAPGGPVPTPAPER